MNMNSSSSSMNSNQAKASFATTFHPGEIAVQNIAGTRGVANELLASKTTELSFSKNHDAFLAAQSFAVIASVQESNQNVWVTPIFSRHGDINANSPTEIVVSNAAIPKDDPLLDNINITPSSPSLSSSLSSPMSMLGIDLEKRIRHRIMGRVQASQATTNNNTNNNTDLVFTVDEYAPNCPKYINQRRIHPSPTPVNASATRQERQVLLDTDRQFLQQADTLFIGSHAYDSMDVNHRGGRPGFIRITSDNTIEWPEYRGNGMYFTSGNLHVNQKAGVTVMDFETGSILQLTGQATVDWNHDGTYEGANRVVKFTIDKVAYTENATHHRWELLEYSPYNPRIAGSSSDSAAVSDSDSHRREMFPATVTLAKIVPESEHVKTFRFVADRVIPFLPGMYATFDFPAGTIPGSSSSSSSSEIRTWTISETPNSIRGDNTIDITVKRIPNGLVTNWLHDHAAVGMQIQLNGVQGDMTAVKMDEDGKPTVPKQLLLLSAGIGITPNLAMVRGIGAFELQHDVRIRMIHVERHEKDLLAQSELQRRARSYPDFSLHNVITSRDGRLTKDQLMTILSSKDHHGGGSDNDSMSHQEAYICGPTRFMSDMTEYLVALGVPAGQIHTESFDF
jgi:uncharacterized protein